jgi:hypothetical protein
MATVHRVVESPHVVPGRVRVRVSGLPLDADEAVHLAEALARLPGVTEVKVDRRTGSVLCLGTDELGPGPVVEKVTALVGAVEIPAEAEPLVARPSGVAREIGRLFHDLDRGVLHATDGHLDLATLATFSFIGAGALEVAIKQKLPAPPWFNLAWWGFRTFTSLEGDALRNGGPAGAPAPHTHAPAKE